MCVCGCANLWLTCMWWPEDNLNYFSPSWGGLGDWTQVPPFGLIASNFTCWTILPVPRNIYFCYGKCNFMGSTHLAWSLRAERIAQTFPRASLALLGWIQRAPRYFLSWPWSTALVEGEGWAPSARFLLSLCWIPTVQWWLSLGCSFRRDRSFDLLGCCHWPVEEREAFLRFLHHLEGVTDSIS